MGMNLGNASGRGAMGLPPARGIGGGVPWSGRGVGAMSPAPQTPWTPAPGIGTGPGPSPMGPGPGGLARPLGAPLNTPSPLQQQAMAGSALGQLQAANPAAPASGASIYDQANQQQQSPPPSSYWYGRGQVGTPMNPAMAAQAPAGNSSYWYGRGQGGSQSNPQQSVMMNPMARMLAGG
jgi:hypothetical protein